MGQTEAPLKNKVKDVSEGLDQAIRVSDLLEEADFLYDLGIAQPFFAEIRRYLNESIRFYQRHRNSSSSMKSVAKRHLKLANKIAFTTLVRGLNRLLAVSGEEQLKHPITASRIERTCHHLFHYVGEPKNVRESPGSSGTKDGVQDASPLPMA